MMRFELAELIGFVALGAIGAALHLGALEWNIRLYCRSNSKLAFLFHVLRLCGMAAVLAFIARAAGAAALVAAVGGFEAARIPMAGSTALRIGKIR
jgi:F1F0 ATPase subunit 2